MLAEGSGVVEWGTFTITVIVGGLAALGTFAAVIGQWYSMGGRADRAEAAQGEMKKTLDGLVLALKGEGEETGIAGKVKELLKSSSSHERQLSKIWRKIGDRPDASGSPPALGDSNG